MSKPKFPSKCLFSELPFWVSNQYPNRVSKIGSVDGHVLEVLNLYYVWINADDLTVRGAAVHKKSLGREICHALLQ